MILDLASSALGSAVVKADKGFFIGESSILQPSKDCDKDIEHWCVIKLGQPGDVVGIDIDISHSSLETVSIEGVYDPNCTGLEENLEWITLLDRAKLTALDRNIFAFNNNSPVACTTIRVKKHSIGNIERISIYGHIRSENRDNGLHENPQHLSLNIPTIQAEPLSSEAYAPYGDVIDATATGLITSANQGTAEKYHHVALVTNTFPKVNGKMNLCIYHCRPAKELPFTVKLLERHPYSSQAFIPMTDGQTRGYLVIVALNGADDRPDMSTLKAFVASSKQGINYHQGVWHHPMVVLEHETDFVCIVHESDIPEDNCHEVNVVHTRIYVPGF
ncbi:ureidoglycolate hydrolase-domain-containing protein [Choanephora cucurbitarum]|nr:ureidoglycolate hydrolase-domain-containing protein [Choanephora cucurbitarum]